MGQQCRRLHCMVQIGVAGGCCCSRMGGGGDHIQSPQTCGCQQSEGYLSWQTGWSGPPGGVRGTFEPPSAARSGVKRAPGGARKAMILWPWRLLPGTSLALQTNTRSCSMSRLLQDMIRVTSSVFALSDLKRETEKTVLAVVRMKPLFAGTAQHVNCLNYRCVFYSICGDKRAHFLIISFMICFDIL